MGAGDVPITTARFDNLDTIDAHLFDHLAIDPSPVPPTIYLLGTCIAALAGRMRKRLAG